MTNRNNKKNKTSNENKANTFEAVWYPGHMHKTKMQMTNDMNLIDIALEITDARIPYSSRNPDIENLIKNKKKIIILNKEDLADNNITNEWIKYYKSQGITAISIQATKKNARQNVIDSIKNECKDLTDSFAEKGRVGRKIKVMVFGIPNVGKSTFINMLLNRNSAKVENRPGVTKTKQWVSLDSDIELMDTPGMLWPKFQSEEVSLNLAFTNSIGQNAIDNEEVAFYLLKYLCKNYPSRIEERYGVNLKDIKSELNNTIIANSDDEINQIFGDSAKLNETEFILEVRDQIARKKGCLVSGGRVDELKVSNVILNDFQSGKLGRISLERPNK